MQTFHFDPINFQNNSGHNPKISTISDYFELRRFNFNFTYPCVLYKAVVYVYVIFSIGRNFLGQNLGSQMANSLRSEENSRQLYLLFCALVTVEFS